MNVANSDNVPMKETNRGTVKFLILPCIRSYLLHLPNVKRDVINSLSFLQTLKHLVTLDKCLTVSINTTLMDTDLQSHFSPFLSRLSTPHLTVTSGIPFFLFLVLLPFSIPWMEVDSIWICVVHYLACLCPTVGSVVYHVFMNHVGGEHVYDTLLSLDMFGVCLVNTLGRSLMLISSAVLYLNSYIFHRVEYFQFLSLLSRILNFKV